MNVVTPVAAGFRRTQPRVWVETLWLLESLEAEEALREVPLQPGLNLILSEPTEGSAGHGVGKTAFCQLLRFVLEDPQWAAGTPLRDELCNAMPSGAVAARVHVGGEAWTVLKPWQHQKRYRAAREATWQQLARNEADNEHDAYVQALHEKLVNILPVKSLPGSNQPIQWQHILAWCSRDQGSRYQSYYHWRIEGTGFSLPAQSPALLVRIVLGLLKDASYHNELKARESELSLVRSKISDMERRPHDLLAHVKHQLAELLGVEESSPFHSTSLFEESSLYGRAQQTIERLTADLQRLQKQQEALEQERLSLLEQRAPLLSQIKAIENRVAQLRASIDGNDKEVERLKKEPEALEAMLLSDCVPGNRLLRDCDYVCNRLKVIELNTVRDTAGRQKNNQQYQAELRELQPLLQKLNIDISPFDTKLSSLTSQINYTNNRALDAHSRQRHLEQAIADYERYEKIVADASGWQELAGLKSKEAKLEQEKGRIQLALHTDQSLYKERKQSLASRVNEMARQLPGFTWGTFDENQSHPFQMGPMHSTTYGVLETLAGDLACLLDSNHAESSHPGFLLHDSPREAEMSEVLFWSLLQIAKDNAETSWQYVVTTSTSSVAEFESFVRLRLHSQDESGFLFKRRIGMEAQPLDL